MYLKICPYFPFNISVWLNGHNWLKCQLQKEGIAFQTRDNLFVECARPERLQELSDAFAPTDIVPTVDAWLARLLPFFSEAERQQGFRHQLYMARWNTATTSFQQAGGSGPAFCAAHGRHRGIGRPDKLAIIFADPTFVPTHARVKRC